MSKLVILLVVLCSVAAVSAGGRPPTTKRTTTTTTTTPKPTEPPTQPPTLPPIPGKPLCIASIIGDCSAQCNRPGDQGCQGQGCQDNNNCFWQLIRQLLIQQNNPTTPTPTVGDALE